MKAVYINEFGDASNIIVGTLAMPTLKKDEVLIKTLATTINKVDIYIRKGLYPLATPMPLLLGRDVVGVVVNAHHSKFKEGDIVWSNSLGYETRNGASASFLAVSDARLYKLAPNVDYYQAVSALHALTTAVLLLTDLIKLAPNSNILIQGGAGFVGRKLVEVAKILKANVFTTSHRDDFRSLSKLGATCFDYKTSEYNVKFDVLIDTSGQNKLSDNVKLLQNGGKILMITAPVETSFDSWDFYTNGKQILGFVLSKQTAKQLAKAAKFINKYFALGYFLANDITILTYDKIKQYHELIEHNKSGRTRPVFTFD